MTRALTLAAMSVFGGLLLWWHAAMVGTAIYSAASGSVTMSMVRDVLSLLPAFVYTVVVWGPFSQSGSRMLDGRSALSSSVYCRGAPPDVAHRRT